MGGPRFIEFISTYCDHWCERCPLTHRCSHFAARSAMAMCDGDFGDALDLALAASRDGTDDDDDEEEDVGRPWLADLESSMASEAEMHAIEREHDALERRVDNMPIMQLARAYSMLTHRWLRGHPAASTDAIVAEALDVVAWDQFFITVKLHRALSGRERPDEDAIFGDDPVQTDYNGSAKVALISIERSEAAWRAIASAVDGTVPAVLADQLAQLRDLVDTAFPHAREFRRPGFDGRT